MNRSTLRLVEAERQQTDDKALECFKEALDPAHVLTDPETLRRYGLTTSDDTRLIDAVVRPGSTEEVRQLVRLASTHHIALYPISGGRNWGYGSANPVRDHNVVVDLSRMNRIIEVNAELAYAVVEPGVTQGQLAEYLRQNDIPLQVDPTGAGPNASLVGNALERGFGLGPCGDHFGAVCGLEIVLPDGELLRTGFSRFENAKASHVYRWGVGPYIDGLFTQSNFGIVTRLGLWLAPRPEHIEVCCFSCTERELCAVIDSLRPLMLHGALSGAFRILHRDSGLAILGQVQDAPKGFGIGEWNGVIPLQGTFDQVQAAKKGIRRALKHRTDRLAFVSEKTVRLLELVRTPLRWLGVDLGPSIQSLRLALGAARGVPTEEVLKLVYPDNAVKTRPARDLIPDRDGRGLMWLCPMLPMTGDAAQEMIGIVRPILERHGRRTLLSLTSIDRRGMSFTLPILFERNDSKEAARARACHADLIRACAERGYYAYRLGIDSMAEATACRDPYWDFVQRLKRAVDPAGILAPGRYSR